MKKILWVLTGSILCLGFVPVFHYGKLISVSDQWPIFEALRTTAAIIFAVVGAWLAIIYPEKIKTLYRSSNDSVEVESTRFGVLLSPAVHSTAILSVVMILGVFVPILKNVSYLLAYKDILRGLFYSLAYTLTVWQLWTVILTLIPADAIKSQSDRNRAIEEGLDKLFSRTQKK